MGKNLARGKSIPDLLLSIYLWIYIYIALWAIIYRLNVV
ncbi:hypothetical protein EU95_0073 [Prochlorococcus marinus str. MIT 9201]|uniref:Uncharacterized protein n=1 Tax=Prochlorococcus marinus str. MIT 9201 TaxID=93057 RepID=A0A0A2A7T5_PROMR|nr:hypothetical protein EU95_0073 [Prochlorococcus marinus str. MIT 9201]